MHTITAAMLAIGDELLSGRTKDKNISLLAQSLTEIGIELKEVRIVADEEADIIAAVNALRIGYNYVFTSGGIGPTHDDITAQAIAAAFDLPVEHDIKAMDLLSAFYAAKGLEFNEARQRMARMPITASHIANKISVAPGFRIDNVFVMAGVPSIFEAMLHEVLPILETGNKMQSIVIECPFGEGMISKRLADIQTAHPETNIGSYPTLINDLFKLELIVRSHDKAKIDAAAEAISEMLQELTFK
jgi:molybdenum cofactor synthesis domain-containing protein